MHTLSRLLAAISLLLSSVTAKVRNSDFRFEGSYLDP
jgi:hypothetical protein